MLRLRVLLCAVATFVAVQAAFAALPHAERAAACCCARASACVCDTPSSATGGTDCSGCWPSDTRRAPSEVAVDRSSVTRSDQPDVVPFALRSPDEGPYVNAGVREALPWRSTRRLLATLSMLRV